MNTDHPSQWSTLDSDTLEHAIAQVEADIEHMHAELLKMKIESRRKRAMRRNDERMRRDG